MKDEHGVCVLLVEDHADTLALTTRLLRMNGYTVHAAASVDAALNLAACELCDLVIADIELRDGSGLDLMQTLRDQYGLKGIAVSSHADMELLAIAYDVGFVAHLTKPVKFDDLLIAVRQAVPLRRDAPPPKQT